jgi:uncharacterized protein involved in exopolysaccharide biosynthesis
MDQLSNRAAHDELSLADYFRQLWQARLLIATVALATALLGLAAGVLLPKKYDAQATIEPVLDTTESGRLGEAGSLSSSYSGLAALAGISMPEKTKNEEALAVLQSEQLTRQFIVENNLLPVLYPKKWNAATGAWRSGVTPPTLWQANRAFKSMRNVLEDRQSGLVTLTIRWKDPVQAAAWANDLVRMTNDIVRGQAIQLAERSIGYLNQQAAQTTAVEVKSAIYSLMEDEVEKEMIARGSEQYALKVIDPAYAPTKPAWPRPILMTVLGAFAGILLSAMWIYIRSVFQIESSHRKVRAGGVVTGHHAGTV